MKEKGRERESKRESGVNSYYYPLYEESAQKQSCVVETKTWLKTRKDRLVQACLT